MNEVTKKKWWVNFRILERKSGGGGGNEIVVMQVDVVVQPIIMHLPSMIPGRRKIQIDQALPF